MKKLTIDSKHICDLPVSWTELSPYLVKSLCGFLLTTQEPSTIKLMMMLRAANLTLKQKQVPANPMLPDQHLFVLSNKKTGNFFASTADIMAMSECFDFLFSYDKDKNPYLDPGFVNNYFGVLKTRFYKKLYGPCSALYNLKFSEFIRAESLFSQLQSNPSEELLDNFIAVLYREKDPDANPRDNSYNGDMRIPYNDHLLPIYSKSVRHLNQWQKLYVKLFYISCRSFIIDKHPEAFNSGSASGNEKTTFENFNQLVTQLSNKDLTKAESIRNAPLYDVMAQLESFALEGKKIREIHSNKTKY